MPDFPPIDVGRNLLRTTFTNNVQPASTETAAGFSADGFSSGLRIHQQKQQINRTQTTTTPTSRPTIARGSDPQTRRPLPPLLRTTTGNEQRSPGRLEEAPQRIDRVSLSDSRTDRAETARRSDQAASAAITNRNSADAPDADYRPNQTADVSITRQTAGRDPATSAGDEPVQEVETAPANGETSPVYHTDEAVQFSPLDEIDAALSPPHSLLPLIVAPPSAQTEQLSYGDLLPDAISATEEFLLPAVLPELIPGVSNKLPVAVVSPQNEGHSLLAIDEFSVNSGSDESNQVAAAIQTDLPPDVEVPFLNDALVPLDVMRPDTASGVESETAASSESDGDIETTAFITPDVSSAAGIGDVDEALPESSAEASVAESPIGDRILGPVEAAAHDTSSVATTTEHSDTSDPQPAAGMTVSLEFGANAAPRPQLDQTPTATRDSTPPRDLQPTEPSQPADSTVSDASDATVSADQAESSAVNDASVIDNVNHADSTKSVSVEHTVAQPQTIADRDLSRGEPVRLSVGNSDPALLPEASDSNQPDVAVNRDSSGEVTFTPTQENSLIETADPTAGSAASKPKPHSAVDNITVPADDVPRPFTDEQRSVEQGVAGDINQDPSAQDTLLTRLSDEAAQRSFHSEDRAGIIDHNNGNRFTASQAADSPADQPVVPLSPADSVQAHPLVGATATPEAISETAPETDSRGQDRSNKPVTAVTDGTGQYAFNADDIVTPVSPGPQIQQSARMVTSVSPNDVASPREVTAVSGSADVEGAATTALEQPLPEQDHGFSDRLPETTDSRPLPEVTSTKSGGVPERTTAGSRAPVAIPEAVDAVQQAMSGEGHIRVRLNPPELGSLFVEVSRDRDGVLVARLEVESVAAHQAVTDTLADLQQALNQTGVSVDRLELVIAGQASNDRGEGHDEPSQDQSQREQSRQEQRGQEQSRDDASSRRQSRRDQQHGGAGPEDFAAASNTNAINGSNSTGPDFDNSIPALVPSRHNAAGTGGNQNQTSGHNNSIDVSL